VLLYPMSLNIREILKKIVEEGADPNDVLGDDFETFQQIDKQSAVYGAVPQVRSKYAVTSNCYHRESYMKRFILTSMVAFLMKITEPSDENADPDSAAARRFITKQFKFDPERHLRKATTLNPNDPQSVKPDFEFNEAPAEVFFNFERFLVANLKDMRNLTEYLYRDKPQLIYSNIIHDVFDTEEAAIEYVNKHKSAFMFPVEVVKTGKWHVMGPENDNLDQIKYFDDRKQGVLKALFDQQKADMELGNELMQHRAKKHKKRDLSEHGPDHPSLGAYAKDVTETIDKFENMTNIDGEQRELLRRAYEHRKALELSPDQNMVNVISFDKDGNMKRGDIILNAEGLPNTPSS